MDTCLQLTMSMKKLIEKEKEMTVHSHIMGSEGSHIKMNDEEFD